MNKSVKNLNLLNAEIDYILSTVAIRDRALQIFEKTVRGETHFTYNPIRLSSTTEFVLQTIRKNYPSLKIPFHSRWGHFRAGGVDRAAEFARLANNNDAFELARKKLDLVITSVLLDAGAGSDWHYFENQTQKKFQRSEGLGVASYHMFLSGIMSADKKSLRADASGLQNLTHHDLEKYFQVSNTNPLVGVGGRVELLNNLGRAVANSKMFIDQRPGNIFDFLINKYGREIPATGVLRAVLDGFGSIWPGRLSAGSVNLGDVWIHPALGAPGTIQSLVPIHKLSQWMTYSLIEPIEEAGVKVIGVEELTGLAEYRNGGLFLDMGLLSFSNPEDQNKSWTPDSELIVEWRALTVYLLDQVGSEIQKALGQSAKTFPLAKVLEGGTWWAGRFIASEKRPGGTPPLNIISDGTVF